MPAKPSPATAGAALAVASMSSIQLSQALSVGLFARLSALGTGSARLAFAGLLTLVVLRPRPRGLRRKDLAARAALGAVTAAMMLLFTLAVARIPLGVASALEFLGPLGLSLVGARGRRRWWGGVATVGVALLTQPWHGGSDLIAISLALSAAACWAAYIVLTQHVGDRASGLGGLSISLPVAGVIGLVVAVPSVRQLSLTLLLATLGLGALGVLLPLTLEYLALRRLTASAFGTMMSSEPAIALLAGLVVLGQRPSLWRVGGVVLVVAAGIAATRGAGRVTDDRPGPASDEERWMTTDRRERRTTP